MSEEKPLPPAATDSNSAEPKRIRLKPSQNQKQRSRLKQGPESTNAPPPAAPAPAPAPVAPAPPPAPPESEPLIRKMRLKRSGQMREDMFMPQDGAPAKREEEY